MPIATYNKRHLMRTLGFKIGYGELIRNIMNLGLVVKRETDTEVDIEFKANRPDIISAVGLARAVRYFMRKSRKFDYNVVGEEAGFQINVGSGVARIRPYVAGMVVTGVRMDEGQLTDLINFTDKLSENYGRKRKRIAIGLHDLKQVKPPLYYDAYGDEEFVPLGKARPMKFGEVLKKEQKGIKYGALLGESQRKYVALKDSVGTLALVPIINSERTKVTAATKNLLVDITGSTKHVIEKVADMLAANFIDMGCVVHCVKVNYAKESHLTPGMRTETVSLTVDQVENEVGVKIGFNNGILLANKMGYEAALIGNRIRFRVPAYRLDYINEQDLIEDIAIAYGYDYIRPVPVPSTATGTPDRGSVARNTVSEAMVGMGYGEAMNSYLTSEKRNFGMMRLREQPCVTISNPKTETVTMMRTWLVPSLLECLAKSAHDRLPQRIFEVDLAFGMKAGKPEEAYRLAAVTCDARVNFNEAKADLEALGKALDIDFKVEALKHDSFIGGRCAAITVGGKKAGFFGEVHPEVLENFGIEEPVLAMEIDLSKIAL